VVDAELLDFSLLIFDGDGVLHARDLQGMGKGAQDKVLVVVGVIDEQSTHVHLLRITVSLMFGTMCMKLTFSRLTSGALHDGYASAMIAPTVPGVFYLSAFCNGGQPRLKHTG
jgi:hypothetical protein